MIKLVVFDLDNTLAPQGKGICEEDILQIKRIQACGVSIAACSGKPVGYLCGFFRQAGLEDVFLIGENGASLQKGINYPPPYFDEVSVSPVAKETIRRLTKKMQKRVPSAFFQPNRIELTVFPTSAQQYAEVAKLLDEEEANMQDVEIYRHADCFDVVPLGVNKQSGMARLSKMLGVLPEQTVAVGDGVNDYPMFEYAGTALGVNVADDARVDRNFNSITEVLAYIFSLCSSALEREEQKG